jgi:hypothetical protein
MAIPTAAKTIFINISKSLWLFFDSASALLEICEARH